MARGVREGEKFPPSSIATFIQHLPSITAADLRSEGERENGDELFRLMLDAKLTRCEFIYLTSVCRFSRSAVEGFCQGRIYDPSLQVLVTNPGPYAQTHAVFMRMANGKLYRFAVNLMQRADRHLYNGARIEPSGPFPHGWTEGTPALLDMLKAREDLDLILNNDPYRSCAVAMQDEYAKRDELEFA